MRAGRLTQVRSLPLDVLAIGGNQHKLWKAQRVSSLIQADRSYGVGHRQQSPGKQSPGDDSEEEKAEDRQDRAGLLGGIT